MDDKMLGVSKQPSNKGFYRHLNTSSVANDVPANNVMYYDICWIKAKREADRTNETVKENDYINALSAVEIIHFVEKQMLDPSGKLLDMNVINETYQQVLSSNSKDEAFINRNYKKYLKNLIFNNITEVSFVKNKTPTKPEQLKSTRLESEIVDNSIKECTTDNMEKIMEYCQNHS